MTAPRSWWRRRLSNVSLASCWCRCPGSLPASPEPMRCFRCPLAGSQSFGPRRMHHWANLLWSVRFHTACLCMAGAWRSGALGICRYCGDTASSAACHRAAAPHAGGSGCPQSRAPEWLIELVFAPSASYANISEHTIIKCTQILAGPPPPPCLVYQRQSCVKCRLSTPMVTRRCSCYPLVARKPILLGGVAKECLCRH